MGFASVVGQVFLVIIFMLIFAQLYIVQHRQNSLQSELYTYQKNQLEKQSATSLQFVQAVYNTTWNTTNIEIRNTGSKSIQINNSDLYIDDAKLPRSYTNRKWFACYEYTNSRCGEIRFGDNTNNEETSLLLLYHFNNDTQWSSTGLSVLAEEYANVGANELTINSAVINSSGKFDRALYFNGTTAYLNRTNTAQNAFTNTTSYTWAFWLKPTALPNTASTIVSKDAAATGYSIYLNSAGAVIFRSANAGSRFNCSINLPLNQWSHVAIVYVGTAAGQVRFYINGTSIINQSHLSILRSDAASAFNIGRNVSTTADYYSGLIDEYAMYNVAKTDADIRSLYRKGVYSNGLYNLDPDEILDIDAYQTLASGAHTITYSTNEGVTVSATVVV